MSLKTKQKMFNLSIIIIVAMLGVAGVLTAVSTPTIIHAAGPWYVNDATGNDSNNCTSAGTACKTVTAALNKISAGDTINIADGTYNEHLVLSQNVTISGTGSSNVFLDGTNTGQVVVVNGGTEAILQGVTVRNGLAISSTSTGGGIHNGGVLTIKNSTIISNSANGQAGGGIGNTGTLTLTQSVLANNHTSHGGAIYHNGNRLVLQEVTVRDNVATTSGGGLFLDGNGIVIIEGTTISNNRADYSEGAFHLQGIVSAQITNTTISGNSASINSAFMVGYRATFLNCTIVNNHTTNSNGTQYAIANYGRILFENSIVANSSDNNDNCYSSITSLGYNLSDDNSCFFVQTGDVQNSNPQLGALADNGGETKTHALLISSPAVDSGTNSSCPSADQRDAVRPFDGNNDGTATCDKGAYELSNQVSIADTAVLEGDSGSVTAVFTLTLAPTSTKPVTVTYTTADDTATAGSDYTATSGTLTFAAGEGSKTVNVAVLGDTVDEMNETFFVNLSNIEGAQLMDAQAVGQIVDNDGLPALAINDVTVTEGDSGMVTAIFTVTLLPPSGQPVTVQYATADNTASAGSDYTTISGTLTFAVGETAKPLTVTVQGDVVDEGNSETYALNLSNATNAAIQDGSGAGVITDDDTAALAVDDIRTDEGNDGVFTVTLSTPSATTVTVDYATSNGTAVAGSDYVAANGTLTFTAGVTEQTVSIQTVHSSEVEPEEYFRFTLSNAQGEPISNSSAVAYITDSSAYGQLQFSSATYTVTENVGIATITVTRTGGDYGAVTVHYATSDNTATAGDDYTATSGTLTFANGETNKTFTVPITDDVAVEGSETITLTLSNATGGASLGTPTTATLTITNTVYKVYLPMIVK